MPLSENPIIFANNPLDRMGHIRNDADWLDGQLNHETALFLPLWNLSPLILPELQAGAGRDMGWLPRAALKDFFRDDSLVIFLGLNRRQKPLFGLDISAFPDPENFGDLKGMGQFEDLRELAMAGDIAATELAIVAQAKALIDWHKRHQFCSVCGAASHFAEAGYKRICLSCGAEHFPRTDPVVIMLGVYEDQCLIGRQNGWPEHMFSALAGFVEPGETIEEAVAREMMEEAGVDIESVDYIASQPWPFPASLMIGCIAQTTSQTLNIDGVELAEARWVSRDEVRAALRGEGTLGVPPKMAIAHHLIRAFAEG